MDAHTKDEKKEREEGKKKRENQKNYKNSPLNVYEFLFLLRRYIRVYMYVRSLTSGPKFHGRKSSLATRPRNPSRSDSDEHEEEARDETPSSQVAGPGNVAKKTGSDSRRRYPSCVPHGHVGAGMRALVHRPLPSPFPPRCATQPHTRSSQTSPSLRNSTGLACTMFFAHERESAFIESKGESYKV